MGGDRGEDGRSRKWKEIAHIRERLQEQFADRSWMIGRASGEEEEPQGSCHEASEVHSPLCERHNDRWQEKGMHARHNSEESQH